MQSVDYDDLAYRLCLAIVSMLVSPEFHDLMVERLKEEAKKNEC